MDEDVAEEFFSERSELKCYERYTTNSVAAWNTGSAQPISLLGNILNGDRSFERVGRKIFLQNIEVVLDLHTTFTAVGGTTAPPPPQTLRFVVLWDHNGSDYTTETFQGVFGITQAGTVPQHYFAAPVQFEKSSRFEVIYDEVIVDKPVNYPPYVTTGTANANTTSLQRQYNIDINREVSFEGDEPMNGNLLVWLVARQGASPVVTQPALFLVRCFYTG